MCKGISITTIYKGQERTCDELAALATEEPRPSAQTIYWRLWRAGKPKTITGELAKKILAPLMESRSSRRAAKLKDGGRFYTLLPDNTKHTAQELSKMFGVPRGTLHSRRTQKKNPQVVFTREELEEMGEMASLRRMGVSEKPETSSSLASAQGYDLRHLSDKENTGAGKGEIPDHIWCNRNFGNQNNPVYR